MSYLCLLSDVKLTVFCSIGTKGRESTIAAWEGCQASSHDHKLFALFVSARAQACRACQVRVPSARAKA